MSIIIKGGATSNLASVTANNELQVALPQAGSITGSSRNPGYATILCENDPGSITGVYNASSPQVSTDFRMRVGLDTILFNDTMNYAAQWFAAYIYYTSTLTTTWSGGYGLMNAANNTAAGSTSFGTYRYFPVIGNAPLYFESVMSLTNTPSTNFVFYSGLYTRGTSAPYLPTDGVYFKITSAGIMGAINYNGVETTTSVFMASASIAINTAYRFVIALDQKKAQFWINDILYGTYNCPVGQSQVCMSGSLPASWDLYNIGIVTTAVQVKVGTCTVSLADYHTTKDWSAQMTGMGYMGQQAAPGQTAGLTGTFANNANPAGFTPTNTNNPGTTALGGISVPNIGGVSLAVTTDYIISSYLNPVSTTAISGRQLYITGIDFHSVNMGAANAAVNMVYVPFLFFGSSSLTLATANDAAALKMPRRITLGVQSLSASCAIGTVATPALVTTFKSPIVVNPGEYVGIGLRFISGTLTTASQALWTYTKYDAYWE